MKTFITLISMLFVFTACENTSDTKPTPVQSPTFSCQPAVEPTFVSAPRVAPIKIPVAEEKSNEQSRL
jgi:hypothetical protein